MDARDKASRRVEPPPEPDVQGVVRHRIDEALTRGQLRDPDNVVTYWQLRSSNRSVVSEEEAAHAQRLAQG